MSIEPEVGDLYKSDLVIDNNWSLMWIIRLWDNKYLYTNRVERLQPGHALLVVRIIPDHDSSICLYRGKMINVPLDAFRRSRFY